MSIDIKSIALGPNNCILISMTCMHAVSTSLAYFEIYSCGFFCVCEICKDGIYIIWA